MNISQKQSISIPLPLEICKLFKLIFVDNLFKYIFIRLSYIIILKIKIFTFMDSDNNIPILLYFIDTTEFFLFKIIALLDSRILIPTLLNEKNS